MTNIMNIWLTSSWPEEWSLNYDSGIEVSLNVHMYFIQTNLIILIDVWCPEKVTSAEDFMSSKFVEMPLSGSGSPSSKRNPILWQHSPFAPPKGPEKVGFNKVFDTVGQVLPRYSPQLWPKASHQLAHIQSVHSIINTILIIVQQLNL